MAAAEATVWGSGATASKVVSGDFPLAKELESAMVDWVGASDAVLFPTGYQANVGVLSALALPGTIIFSDADNHASIIDGCRLSRQSVRVYPHLDVSALETFLARSPADTPKIIVTDALFSMDGSVAPLGSLSRLASIHGALLVVDEAHSLGVLGPGGRGLCADAGITPDVLVATFSKALGSQGAAALTGLTLGRWLRQRARSLIYSTALPPPSVGASLAALSVARGEQGASLRRRLAGCSRLLRSRLREAGIHPPPSARGSPIVSLPFRGEGTATALQVRLRERGLQVWAFRPPTVAADTSLLRVCLSASHSEADIHQLADALVPLLSSQRSVLLSSSTGQAPSRPPTEASQ
jgi:8-amino-7-oxononanoate synthase